MGPLTESMTRLCSEIVALRGERLHFIRDLRRNVAGMQAQFRHSHSEMARRTKAERQGFVKSLGHEVASLRAGFRGAHKEMARKTKAERRAAVNHLKKTVGWMRREFSSDLAGARSIWFGPSPGELRAKAEAERRAREAAERDRLAAEAMAKEAGVQQKAAPEVKEEARHPGKKKG